MELFDTQMRLTACEDAVIAGTMQQRRNTVQRYSFHEEKSQEVPLMHLHRESHLMPNLLPPTSPFT